jgi:trehalose utilization protein
MVLIDMSKIRVLVWNEYIHERRDKAVQKIYGLEGIHGHIAKFLNQQTDIDARTATLDDEDDAGLSESNLKNTDVLIWWGHAGHHLVEDALVDRIQKHIVEGMGLIVLHSGHFSKIFKKMMGTSCGLNWREDGGRELLWVANPYHPITKGIDPVIELDHEEMYGEYFDIPPPEELIFISWFEGGEVFRSGCTWHRGRGKIFYFRPGHETFPTYTGQSDGSKQVLQVITNAVRWCKFEGNLEVTGVGKASHSAFSLAPVKKYEFEALKEHPKSSNK